MGTKEDTEEGNDAVMKVVALLVTVFLQSIVIFFCWNITVAQYFDVPVVHIWDPFLVLLATYLVFDMMIKLARQVALSS